MASGLLAFAVGACGDDDDDTMGDDDDDVPIVTCGEGTVKVDNECVLEPDGAPAFTCEDDLGCPEGGEVRIEYVNFTDPPGPGGRTEASARITTFLMDDAGTGLVPDTFPMIAFGECHDVGTLMDWPTAQGEDRVYVDYGQVIIDAGGTGGAFSPTAGGVPPAADPLGRTHPGHWNFEFGINDAAARLAGDHPIDLIFTGSDEFPAMALDNVSHIPKPFTLTSPAAGTGPIQLVMGQDKVFTQTVETSDTDIPIGFLVAFVIGGKLRLVCPELQSGSVTVTAADITGLATYGAAGTAARQTFAHKPVDILDSEGVHRRLDVIGIWCNAGPFAIVAAP